MIRIRFIAPALALLLTACTNATPIDEGAQQSSAPSAEELSIGPNAELNEKYTSDAGFTINYPEVWTIKEQNVLVTNRYTMTGTSLIAPVANLKLTLLDAQLHIATAQTCPAQPDGEPITIKDMPFRRSVWNSAGAGNVYMGMTYTTQQNDTCYILTGYMHSCNLGLDCGEHSKSFDTVGMIVLFNRIIETFELIP